MKNRVLHIAFVAIVANAQAYYSYYPEQNSIVFIENNVQLYVNELPSSEQSLHQSAQLTANPKKKNSIFARFIRPPLRTIYKMTDTLSTFLGAGAIYSGINLFTHRNDATPEEKEVYQILIGAWLLNKALYHFTEYAIEETN